MERELCSICQGTLVRNQGPIDAPILIVGAYPNWQEIQKGYLGGTDAFNILDVELGRAGINSEDCRITNLWRHAEVKAKDDAYEEEEEYHFNLLLTELKGRKAVLLMGRQPVERLLRVPISDVESLKVSSEYYPASVKVSVVSKAPSIVLTDGAVVGNVRHAIQRFARLTKEIRQ